MSMESWLQRQERIEQDHCPAKAPDCFGDYGSSPIEDLLKKNIEYTKEMRNMIDKVQIKANHDQPELIKNKINEVVNHPDHYQGDGIECIDAIRAALGTDGFIAYCRGNAIKYSWRAGKKGPNAAEDMGKAAVYSKWAAEAAL